MGKGVREVLEEAKRCGITLWADAGDVCYKTESGPIPPALLQDIKDLKPAMLQVLQVARGPSGRRARGTTAPEGSAVDVGDAISTVGVESRGRGRRERSVAAVAVQLDPETRRKGLGSSDIAKVAGVSSHGTALDVYLEKKGLAGGRAASPDQADWGLRLERAIAEKYAEDHGVTLLGNGRETFIHPDHPWMRATPDRLILRPHVAGEAHDILEIKTAHGSTASRWGPTGTGANGIPTAVHYQVQWQMEVLGARRAVVAVLIGGSDYREYEVERDDELIDDLMRVGRAFWMEHVETSTPPDPQTEEERARLLRMSVVREQAGMVPSTAAIDGAVAELRQVRFDIRMLEKTEDSLVNTIKTYIGQASGVVGPTYRVTWTKTVDKEVVDWKGLAYRLAVRFNDGLYPGEDVDAVTKRKPGVRRFVVKHSGDTEDEERTLE